MKLLILVVVAFATGAEGLAAELTREKWHEPEREYEAYDSVAIPLVDFAAIQKTRVGMSLKKVRKITGFAPVDFYIHPAYAILSTEVEGVLYEVAFWHGKSQNVLAISFRSWSRSGKANKAVDPTPGTAPRDSGGSSQD